jgi:hypothetical protein
MIASVMNSVLLRGLPLPHPGTALPSTRRMALDPIGDYDKEGENDSHPGSQ